MTERDEGVTAAADLSAAILDLLKGCSNETVLAGLATTIALYADTAANVNHVPRQTILELLASSTNACLRKVDADRRKH